jgi:hypothetical protein
MRDEYDFTGRKRVPVLRRPGKAGDSTVDLPVVCTLTPASVVTRKSALLPGLVARAHGREDTVTGMRLRLPADALSAVLETVEAERQCCRFLQFDITVEPDGGPIWLELTGPPGTREFLAAVVEA